MNKIVLDEMEGAGIPEIGGPESSLPYSTPPLRFFTATSHLPTNTSLGDSEQSYRLHRVYFKKPVLSDI